MLVAASSRACPKLSEAGTGAVQALSRMNAMFANGEVHKTYWAVTAGAPSAAEATLTHYISTTERNNKSYASPTPKPGAKDHKLSEAGTGAVTSICFFETG